MKNTFTLLSCLCTLLSQGQTNQKAIDFSLNQVMKPVPAQFLYNQKQNDTAAFYPGIKGQKVWVDSFYISAYEVHNNFYRQYLDEIRYTLKDSALYAQQYPDTLLWDTERPYHYGDPMQSIYFWHPAYDEYPLVTISYDQCLRFCQWVTAQYNKDPQRKFKKVEFTLPTREQFIVAASGGHSFRKWSSPTDSPMHKKGPCFNASQEFYCHSKTPHKAPRGDTHYCTAKVNTHLPNEYGLYNLCGNVEEFLLGYGVSTGGSWGDCIDRLNLQEQHAYAASNEKSIFRGFRLVMKVVER